MNIVAHPLEKLGDLMEMERVTAIGDENPKYLSVFFLSCFSILWAPES